MDRSGIRGKDLQIALVIIVTAALSMVLSFSDGAGCYTDTMGIIWFSAISVLVLIQTSDMRASGNIKVIIALGYFIRVLFAWAQTYIPHKLPSFMVEGSDQVSFMAVAIDYFNGNTGRYYTNFPFVLNGLFHVMGKGELAIRLLFVYLWFLGCVLLERSVGRLEGKRHQMLVAFYALLPWWIYISTAVLRDGIKAFSLMLSLYYLLKWMRYGRKIQIVLSIMAAFPAIVMHAADTAMIIAILVTVVFWDTRTQRWFDERRRGRIVIIPIIILFTPVFYSALIKISPDFIPTSFSAREIFRRISIYDVARTNYVPKMEITNILQFIYWTLYRVFYFWMSPTIRYWSSAGDALMFGMDTVPWILMFCYIVRGIRLGKLDERARVIYILFLLFSFVYAWGTRNAGTAMRHRDHLLGLFVITGLLIKDKEQVCVE